ncbi:DUF1622 domain-containing protein [Arsenicicoccus dermatophilus]|uniref:DUF1622 domain-containing protein n=1 Tax=Arsenicicoccus dermatophilus TaxID=1076331 RepID=UPI0039172E06
MLEPIATGFEIAGSGVLVAGLVLATLIAVRVLLVTRDGRRAYRLFREAFGGGILLGLEILVAADLVRTVAVEPTLRSVATLGLIVLIRTFLSFSLEIEIDGVPPWKRALVSGAEVTGRAVREGVTVREPQP